MKISIFGLGYVGSVTAGCLTEAGHEVIGVDPLKGKVDAFNSGKSPIVEPELDGLLSAALDKKVLRATTKVEEAVQNTDLSIVCVGTPSLESGRLNLDYVHGVSDQIAKALEGCDKKHTIIFRSTMLPGSTRSMVEDHLTDLVESGRLTVYYCPEFLREGTAVEDFRKPSLAVMGTENAESYGEAEKEAILGSDPSLLTWEEAEMIKYSCNYFHAVKIAFANEIGRVGKRIGADSSRVMAAVCRDTRLNISTYYMKPGNPFGGSCLPKDVSALSSFARQEGINLPLLDSVMPTNECHLDHLIKTITSAGSKDVTILGLAFKSDTDDLRGSSMVTVAETLLGRGYTIRVYDPEINLAELMGSNERLISRRMPHLSQLLTQDPKTALGDSGTVVAFRKCVSYDDLKASITPNHTIVDVNGWRELQDLDCPYYGLCW